MSKLFPFGSKHRSYLTQCYNNTWNVAEGAVRASKTVGNVQVFATMLEMTQDKLHLCTGATLSTAKIILGDCDGFGLEHIFEGRCRWGKYKDREALYIDTYNNGRHMCLFVGGGKNGDFKAIRGFTIGLWLSTEFDLHNLDFIKEALRRTAASKMRRIITDLNPSNPQHYVYKEYIDKFIKLQDEGKFPQGINHCLFTIHDNPSLSEESIQNFISEYEMGSPFYRRDILGERIELKGRCFTSWNRDTMIVHEVPFTVANYYIGIDWGYSGSATTCVMIATDGYNVCVVKALREHGYSRSSEDNLDIAEKFINDNAIGYPDVYPDSADFGLFQDLQRRYSFTVYRQKYSISTRVRLLNRLMVQGRLTVLNTVENVPEAIEGATYDDKNARRDDGTSDIDSLDALEYSMYDVFDMMLNQ